MFAFCQQYSIFDRRKTRLGRQKVKREHKVELSYAISSNKNKRKFFQYLFRVNTTIKKNTHKK